MTDKEIIIDGVDVSEWTDEEVRYNFEKHSPKAIRQIAFDLYKQLKRAEQKLKGIKEIVVPIKENTCFGMHCGAIDWILQTIEGKGENNG